MSLSLKSRSIKTTLNLDPFVSRFHYAFLRLVLQVHWPYFRQSWSDICYLIINLRNISCETCKKTQQHSHFTASNEREVIKIPSVEILVFKYTKTITWNESLGGNFDQIEFYRRYLGGAFPKKFFYPKLQEVVKRIISKCKGIQRVASD